MFAVDSSVWIDYFNGKATRETDWLDARLGAEIVVIGDLILAEVLQGFRKNSDFETARELLLSLEQRSFAGQTIALKSAENFRRLRKEGVTVRKTVDCLIATFCIDSSLPLLFSDRDFEPFCKHLGLRSPMP